MRSALEISDTWLSKARKVLEILKEIGEDDPLIQARLDPNNPKKGVELYRFLVERRSAIA